jgi:hypothetical protein
MLKRLTGKKTRVHHGLDSRKAHIPPCYDVCFGACEVQLGDRYVLQNVKDVM